MGSKHGKLFYDIAKNKGTLVVPAITIYEVFKKLYLLVGKEKTFESIGMMTTGSVVDLNIEIAIKAAKFSIDKKIAMADSIIYVTAGEYKATVWTMDADLKGLPNVKYFAKK